MVLSPVLDEAIAYSTLFVTISLAVSRPRIGLRDLRFSPGSAALLGVVTLLLARLLTFDDMIASARIQWRPLLSLTCIMVMTGVVQEVRAFERLACWIESRARDTSAKQTFTLVFLMSVVTPSLLNNDSAILLLTPLIVALTRRLYPGRPAVTEAFVFVVFLAPGVAPLITSNPMNMIVAEFAGVDFIGYAKVMLPLSIAGALLTFAVLYLHFGKLLATTVAARTAVEVVPRHRAERPAVAVLLVVFAAYPITAALGGQIWIVAVAGAVSCLTIARSYRVAPTRQVLRHISPDILVFLWGVFLVVAGLRHVGVVEQLAHFYQAVPSGSGREIATVGVVAAIGSAVVDNHPMSILNMMALGAHGGSRPLLAALIGGDIGPRLLPVGSLAGLLWMDLLRRSGVDISIWKFIRLGTLVLVPTLTVSLVLLWLS